jgi:hypothetical protein
MATNILLPLVLVLLVLLVMLMTPAQCGTLQLHNLACNSTPRLCWLPLRHLQPRPIMMPRRISLIQTMAHLPVVGIHPNPVTKEERGFSYSNSII